MKENNENVPTKPEKSAEKMEISRFGERPSYLSGGLEAWAESCDEQAKEGIAKLKENKRFEVFYSGMANYFHQEPKDIAAAQNYLKKDGSLPKDENLKVRRTFQENEGTKISPSFEKLFSK